jgi:hypothetical protein
MAFRCNAPLPSCAGLPIDAGLCKHHVAGWHIQFNTKPIRTTTLVFTTLQPPSQTPNQPHIWHDAAPTTFIPAYFSTHPILPSGAFLHSTLNPDPPDRISSTLYNQPTVYTRPKQPTLTFYFSFIGLWWRRSHGFVNPLGPPSAQR